jgi:hypothetical protein
LICAPLAVAPNIAHARSGESRAKRPRGRPDIKLDRLDFPSDLPGGRYFEKRLRTLLKREARRADWGAGAGSKIEYRFSVAELTFERQGDVLRVRCTAVGKLPGGKSAKSNLSFGGDPNQRNRVVERVLEIVARGVITRLAELERVRRGDLGQSRVRVRPPPSSD